MARVGNKMAGQRGAILIEFAVSFFIFIGFLAGLIGMALWGLGGYFIQDATHEAVRKYAVTLEAAPAEVMAKAKLNNAAYPFIEADTVSVRLWHDGVKAYGVVTARPRVQRLYLFSMPELRRESSCTLEYRFRNPDEFL